MICYFDTSSLVPILIQEPGSKAARNLWDKCDRVAASRVLYVEGAAALAQAERTNRITRVERLRALDGFEALWDQIDVIEVSEDLVRRAAVLTASLGLRGYDAVHCASAEQANEPNLVVVSGDRQLIRACQELHLNTADTNIGLRIQQESAALLTDADDRRAILEAREAMGSDELW